MIGFEKAKEKLRAKVAEPVEKVAGIAALALVLSILALLVAFTGSMRHAV